MGGTVRRASAPERLLRVAFWMVLLAVVSFTRADPDLWGHVRFGMDILHDGRIPGTDPYSFTTDRPWVNHEWAAEAITASAFQAMGGTGLVLLKIAVVVGFLLLLDGERRRHGLSDARLRDYLAGAAVVTTVQQAHHVRPQIFSLLFFAVLLASLLEAQRGARRALWIVPPVFAMWANFHGGWIVGGAVLALWIACITVKSPRAALPYAVVGVASLAATLLNPYGIGLWRFLWTTVGVTRADITDWQPVYALDASVWGIWLLTAALAAAGLVLGLRARLPFERAVLVIALAVASFRVNRLTGFFALATLFMLGPALARGLQRDRVRGRASSPAVRTTLAVLAAALAAGAGVVAVLNLRCVRIDPRLTPPSGAIGFLQARSGRLLVWFDWGEYAIWHLAPAMRVSVDGRRETVYSAELLERHLAFFFDARGGSSLPATLAADYVWIPRDLPAANRLRLNGWNEVYSDQRSAVFALAEPPQPITTAEMVGVRCFPGP